MKHKEFLIIIALISISNFAVSQAHYKHLNKADKAFFEFNYKKAIRHYELALETDTIDHIYRSLGQSYRHENKVPKALKYLELVALSPAALPLDYLEYAQCLKRSGDYEKAIVWFEKYREIYPLDIRARNHSLSSYYYQKLSRNTKNPLSYSLDMNDFESVLGITKYKDGAILTMTDSKGSGDFMGVPEVYMDLYQATVTPDMQLDKIKYLPFNINSFLNDGPASYSEITQTMAFSSTSYSENSSRTYTSNLEIYLTSDASGKWSEPVPFEHNNLEYSLTHPAFSPDGKTLYFVSDIPGGFGGTDIYVSYLDSGKWSKPSNLGAEINTESNEMFPFVEKGGVLYFSSEGHAGLGGLDVFKTYTFEEFWTKPQNLGAPVNSRYDDYGFTKFSEEQSYFISDRVGGKGLSDVYYLNLEKARDFFSIPTKLIDNYVISEIVLENLSTGETSIENPDQTKSLKLDISQNGYKLSWRHLNVDKQIIITGELDQQGELEIFLKGLDGLEPKDFISGITVLGQPSPKEIKIDQKVWTYLNPKTHKGYSQIKTDIPNYVAGADDVIQLTSSGDEIRKETYPRSKTIGKEIFYIDDLNAQNLNSYYKQADKLVEQYLLSNSKQSLAITLVNTPGINPIQMEIFGEKVEAYLISKGIDPSKLNLSWIDDTSKIQSKELTSNYEIFITVNSQLGFVE